MSLRLSSALSSPRIGVGEADPAAGQSRGPEPHHVRLPRGQLLLHLLRRRVPPDGPLAVVAGQRPGRPLLGGDVLQVGLGREVQVGPVLAEQLAHVGQVDLGPAGLHVRAVVPAQVVLGGADREVGQPVRELIDGALGDPGLVGVLDPQQVDTAGLAGQVGVDHRRVDPADVQVTGRAGPEPGDLGLRRQIARRVPLLPVLRTGQVLREQRIYDGWAEHGQAGSIENGATSQPTACPAGGLAGCLPAAYLTGVGLMPVRIRWPASTGIVTPVTLAARSEFRYSAVSAMTCGSMNDVPLSAVKW